MLFSRAPPRSPFVDAWPFVPAPRSPVVAAIVSTGAARPAVDTATHRILLTRSQAPLRSCGFDGGMTPTPRIQTSVRRLSTAVAAVDEAPLRAALESVEWRRTGI